jgi:hypothetical protein
MAPRRPPRWPRCLPTRHHVASPCGIRGIRSPDVALRDCTLSMHIYRSLQSKGAAEPRRCTSLARCVGPTTRPVKDVPLAEPRRTRNWQRRQWRRPRRRTSRITLRRPLVTLLCSPRYRSGTIHAHRERRQRRRRRGQLVRPERVRRRRRCVAARVLG